MKPGDLEYQALVEKKRAEIRGNISSIKMTESETQAEISQITGGVFDGRYIPPESEPTQQTNIPKRRGRPPGSKNRPKGS